MKLYHLALIVLLTNALLFLSSNQHRQEFERVDQNDDGYLDAQEIRLSITGLSEDDITSIFDFYDKDRDGVLSYEEYLSLIINSNKQSQQQEQ